MTDLTKYDNWAGVGQTEIKQDFDGNTTENKQLTSLHSQLQQHIQLLSSNAQLINTHCYLMDEFTESCKENIERECRCVTKAIENRKNELLNQLYVIQKSKAASAREIFISIAKELKSFETIKLEMEHVISCQMNEIPSQAYIDHLSARINQIKQYNINNSTILHSADLINIRVNFYKKAKTKVLNAIKQFGSFVDNNYNVSFNNNINQSDYRQFNDEENKDVYNYDSENNLKEIMKSLNKRDSVCVSDKARKWRQKQIQIACKTAGYKRLIELFPEYPTNPVGKFVEMPKIDEKIGKKRWKGKYMKFRQFLHLFTDNNSGCDDALKENLLQKQN